MNYPIMNSTNTNNTTSRSEVAKMKRTACWKKYLGGILVLLFFINPNVSLSARDCTTLKELMAVEEACRRIATCAADAEQLTNGNNLLICDNNDAVSDLELGELGGNANQVALNFGNWNIPQGATIISAHIQFTALANSSGTADFTIAGEYTDDAPLYTAAYDVIARPLTSASVAWSVPTWSVDSSGVNEQSPDLSAIIQEIVNRPDFDIGNNIALHITGTGERIAYSNDINAKLAPQLCIVYDTPPVEPEPECTDCPTITLASLDGVPNFPTVNLLNMCSAADTAALLIYNPAECAINDIRVEIVFDQGLFYGGFVFLDANSLSTSMVQVADLSDISKPVFSIDQLDPGESMVIDFAVKANCEVDTETEEDINFDANLSYNYTGAASSAICTTQTTNIGAYNSGLKVPVLNILSISPQELNIPLANTPNCQTLVISQDGISALLNEFQFVVNGLDTNFYQVTSMAVNTTAVPPSDYTYNATTQTLSTIINGTYFPDNYHTGANNDAFFNSDERLTVEICYQVLSCTEESNFLDFQAFYGCNGLVCGDISSLEGTVNFTPDFGANATSGTSSSTAGQVCGQPMIVNFDITSSTSDPVNGLWEELVLRWEACDLGISRTSSIVVNGVTMIEGTHYNIVSNTVVLDFSSWTTDLDGAGGLSDVDGDGLFDDLPGGEVITVMETIDLSCPGDEIPCSAEGVSCTISQIDVRGLRNCGQVFQSLADIDPDIGFTYGGGNKFTNDTIDVDATSLVFNATELYTTPFEDWGASTNGFEFAYDFNATGIGTCQNLGNIYLEVSYFGSKAPFIRYLDNSATYQGNMVAGVTWNYETFTDPATGIIDTIGLIVNIPTGSATPTLADLYFLNFEYLGHCQGATDEYFSFRAIEQCDDCTPTCELVRACAIAPIRVDWQGLCTCIFTASIDSIARVNYGYKDKEMTQKWTIDEVPADERLRFLPGDTMFYRIKWEITGAQNLLEQADKSWSMTIMHWNPQNVAGIPLHSEGRFAGWFIQDQGTGPIQEIGIPTTMQQYPNTTRDNQNYPSIAMRNIGLNSDGDGRYNDGVYDYICEQDLKNLDLVPEYVDYIFGDLTLQSDCCDNRDAWVGWQINWGLNEPCPPGDYSPGINSNTVEDHFNTVYEDFLEEFDVEQGDVIYFDYYVPIVHNPGYDISALNGQANSNTSSVQPRLIIRGNNPDPNSCVGGIYDDCSYPAASYFVQLPNDVDMTNTVEVDDCEVRVAYNFSFPNQVIDGIGNQWFANEYRPFEFLEYLQINFPSNFVYAGDAEIELQDGTIIPIPDSYIDANYGNLMCQDAPTGGGKCCVAADPSELAGLRWVTQNFYDATNFVYSARDDLSIPDTTNYPGNGNTCYSGELYYHDKNDSGIFPIFMVGGAQDCNSWTLRYTLMPLCPEKVTNTDFSLLAQFSEIAVPHFTEENFSLKNPTSGLGCINPANSFATIWDINPYGTGLRSSSSNWYTCSPDSEGFYSYYYGGIRPDPVVSTGATNPLRQTINDVTSVGDFVDTSLDFPPLSGSVNTLLLSDLAGQNEVNRFVVCAGSTGGTTHTNVITSVEIPNTMQLIDIASLSGTGFPFSIAQTLSNSTVYSIQMADLPPGTCDSIEITTELLFCPIGGDLDTKVCIKSTSSSCIAPNKAAAVLAGSEVCDVVNACYEYIAEEADIQSEWVPNPLGPYSLCEPIPVGIRIKNVKPATLVDIVQDIWFPTGLNFVAGSFQLCYPGGPTNTGTCVTIPDPIANPAQNAIFGTNYGYDDVAVWSSYLAANGLPGILTTQDSNRIQILFEVETVCDDFISGTSMYYQSSGADPCESRIKSQFVDSEPIIINGALPEDFAQFFISANPINANCGSNATIDLTFLNISPFGESDESIACMELETATFGYIPGSIRWVAPNTNSSNITEETNGSVTKVCFTVPDGIGPGEAFSMALDFQVPEDVSCGGQDLGVNISSEITDAICIADGSTCSVNVLNTVNPHLIIDFLPPMNVERQELVAQCPNTDGTIDVCYSIDLSNNGDPYSDVITVSVFRDLNDNGLVDDGIDPLLATDIQNVTLPTGAQQTLMGCLNMASGAACPIVLRIEQTTSCVCNSLDYPYTSLQPAIINDAPPVSVLCPGTNFVMESCADWTYAVIPAEGATLTTNTTADSIILTVNEGYGLSNPIKLRVSSAVGGCTATDSDFEIYSLTDFTFDPFDNEIVCEQGCNQLSLGLPADFKQNATVQWMPATYLDDPTSFTPLICNPQEDITYSVEVTFTTSGQSCTFNSDFPVVITPQVTEDVIMDGDLCPGATSIITAPGGYAAYEWIRINADGTETTVASGSTNTWMATEVGTYRVVYSSLGDVCPTLSNEFEVLSCIDYGDLPDTGAGTSSNNYETDSINTGAGHHLISGLNLGLSVDQEADGQSNSTATGDGSDEDGFTLSNTIQWIPNGQVQIPFTVTNTTGQQAEMEIWIDWNGDGDFNDPNELVADLSDDATGDFGQNGYLLITVPADAVLNQVLGVRARLSNEDNMTPYGSAASGEVEDYLITLSCNDNFCLPMSISIGRGPGNE